MTAESQMFYCIVLSHLDFCRYGSLRQGLPSCQLHSTAKDCILQNISENVSASDIGYSNEKYLLGKPNRHPNSCSSPYLHSVQLYQKYGSSSPFLDSISSLMLLQSKPSVLKVSALRLAAAGKISLFSKNAYGTQTLPQCQKQNLALVSAPQVFI